MSKRAHNHKLSDAARAQIDKDLARAAELKAELKGLTCAALAERHNVHESAIKQYKQGKTYKE